MLRTLIAGKKLMKIPTTCTEREARGTEFNDPSSSGAIRQLKIRQPPTPLVKLMEPVDACAICWRS